MKECKYIFSNLIPPKILNIFKFIVTEIRIETRNFLKKKPRKLLSKC